MYIRKVKNGWRVEVDRLGVYRSATRATKAEAQAWGTREEAAILAGARGEFPARTLSDAIDRYLREVVAKKLRNKRTDTLRLESLRRDFPDLCGKLFHEVTTADLAAWRDKRFETVQSGTVLREINIYRPIWTRAINEWGWAGKSPWKGLKMPKEPPPRTRKALWQEVRRLLRGTNYHPDTAPILHKQQAVWAFMVALHTAMRSGEILKMSRSTVDLQRRVYHLTEHKTDGTIGPRHVPFTRRAARLLAVLDAAAVAAGRDAYFTVSDDSRDALFRKTLRQLMIEGLNFHDSRASSLTWLSKRYDIHTLAKISGHVDISLLHNTYYRETAEEVAARL